MTYSISKTFKFCYGHRLFGDEGKCRHLHGHTAKVDITFQSELDENGMVIHFDNLKNTIGKWISEKLDHKLFLYEKDSLAKCLEDAEENFLKLPFNPTAENIAKMIFDKTAELNLSVTQVDVWESETSKATYKK